MQISAVELEQLRKTGKAPISSKYEATLVYGLAPWRTDLHMLPGKPISCFLWAVLVALGMPSIQALVGGRDDAANLAEGI